MAVDAALVTSLAKAVQEALVGEATLRVQAGKPPLSRSGQEALADSVLRERLQQVDAERMANGRPMLDDDAERRLVERVVALTVGLGPVELLLTDQSVEEIVATRFDLVFVYRSDGTIEQIGERLWSSEAELVAWLSHLARTAGRTERQFNPQAPLLVMRLGDGLRLAATRDVSKHVSFALRRNTLGKVRLADLVGREMVTPVVADLLSACMSSSEIRIVFSGPTGSGKTTLVRACLGELEPHERVVVIEDTAELDLFDAVAHPNVESWEARLANNEGEGAVAQGEQVKHALRYRPDWLVCGEVRDSDAAVPMLKAMTHGQSSLTTVHSASAIGALDKLALYLDTGDDRLPPEVAHNQLHQAIDFVVHLERGADGRRHVSELLEVAGFDGQRCTTNTIMTRDMNGSTSTLRRLDHRHERVLAHAGFDSSLLGKRVPMRTLAGAIVGLLAAGGVWLAIVGWTGVPESAHRRTSISWDDAWWRAGLVVGSFVLAVVVTGWPAAGVLAAATAWVAPMLMGVRRRRDEVVARSEAIAAWAEMLRDTISSHAGLQEAIGITAQVAPAAIRKEVQALSVRAERGSLTDALRQFADDVDDPIADLVVASLATAAERQAQRLSDLLSQIAVSAREQTAMRLRVETGRARTYASSKALVAITFGLAVVLMVFSPTFMEPYDTATGQLVLIGIGAMFAGALWGLVQLGRPATSPRLLSGIEGAAEP